MMNNILKDVIDTVVNEANKEENIQKIQIAINPHLKKIERKFYFFILIIFTVFTLNLLIVIYLIFYYKNCQSSITTFSDTSISPLN